MREYEDGCTVVSDGVDRISYVMSWDKMRKMPLSKEKVIREDGHQQ